MSLVPFTPYTLTHVGDQVQLEDDVDGVVGLELVVVLNLEYGNEKRF